MMIAMNNEDSNIEQCEKRIKECDEEIANMDLAVNPEEIRRKEKEEEEPKTGIKSLKEFRKPLRLPAPGEKSVTVERTGTPSHAPAKLTINDLPTEGINLIDRVMAFLESKKAVFSLDDFNRLRRWAADNVAFKVSDKIDSLKKELERLETIYFK